LNPKLSSVPKFLHLIPCLFVLVVSLLLNAAPDSDLKVAVNSTTIESFPLFAAGQTPGIQLVPTSNGRAAMAQLISGAADAATGSETQALLNSVADPRIRIILTLAECRYRVIARRSAGIRRISDLRGKRVAATVNTSSHYYLGGMLRRARLQESDVQVVSMEGPDMPMALQRRSVDAVSIWEPHAQNSLEALGNDAVVLEDPSVYVERFNLNTRSDVLADPNKRRALVRLVEAIVRGSLRIRTRPAEMITALAPNVAYPPRTIEAVWSQFKFPAAISSGLQAALTEVEPWIATIQTRQPRARQALITLIDASLLAEAKK
jgi:ABC-type nitrate/sulfonate/bicarbonate transport system substrate-binding protein